MPVIAARPAPLMCLVLTLGCVAKTDADTETPTPAPTAGTGGQHSSGGEPATAAGGLPGTSESTGGAVTFGGSTPGGTTQSSAGAASLGGNGSGGSDSGFEAVLSSATFASLFPNRNSLYSYEALRNAAAKYPAFAAVGGLEQRRREVAALLANAAHETTGGWAAAPGGPEAWGLYFTQEVGCESGACTQYCDATNTEYPCKPGKTYHGRGPIQLSWNYNYGLLGKTLGLDLLNNPDLVTSNGDIAFETALWFWMTTQLPKPSAHDAILGNWQPSSTDLQAGRRPGFGLTINIINGRLECGMPADERVHDRIRFYQHFCEMLGVSPGENLECASMTPY